MPVNLSIKAVPDALAQRLRERAERNHRSLQGELMALIERAAAEPHPEGAATPAQRTTGTGLTGVRRGTKTIEQIAAEHRLLYPEPFKGGPLAVDIIRADRDSR
jgi:plasmid stability protein